MGHAVLSGGPHEAGIRLGSSGQGEHRATCPECSHKRRKKNEKCLAVLIDADGWALTGRLQ